MFEDAIDYIKKSSKESSVYIGSDSIRFKKKSGEWFARFSTVVIIHIDGCKGGKIFYDTITEPDYGVLQTRLLREVGLAVDVANLINPHLGGRTMEIHLDINSDKKHKSSIAVKEALGWVTGMGYDAKVKPESWAASHAADHVVKLKKTA